jgi:squalene-hopene/tetraprenyl-beta-curcumene cyclase
LRRPALRRAERWILDHQKDTDGLGAIFPPMVNAILAFKAMDYPDDHEAVQHELRELARYEIDRGDDIRMQPCLSPVWDTALSMVAMRKAGAASDDEAVQSAGRWLIEQEISVVGDWGSKVENPQPSGWCFEYNNPFYPDIDDTIMVLMALYDLKLEGDEDRARSDACVRGLGWVLSLQSKNGGWGSFDKDNTKSFLTKLPFADHNAMIDPPTADITARTLECLAQYGFTKSDECVRDAISFLRREQDPDGSWFGRWGVNYIYGTWQALKGLADIGEDMNAPYVRKAVDWLLSVQNEDGGWGESCETYLRPNQKGKGISTPSQTAWAVMGLISAGISEHPTVESGIRRLLDTQRNDGNWDESEFTGTGFPKVFYLEYTMYRLYFPVMALGMYQDVTAEREQPATAEIPGSKATGMPPV